MNVSRPFFTWRVTNQKRRIKRERMNKDFLCFAINPGIRFSRFLFTPLELVPSALEGAMAMIAVNFIVCINIFVEL
jgi:hypothetical protein